MDAHRIERITTAAEGYLELGMPKQALREIRRLSARAGDGEFRVKWLQGRAYQQLEQYDDALAEFHAAQLMDPAAACVFASIAACLRHLGRIDPAIDAAEAAYSLSPDDPVCLYNLACYCCLAGQREQALSWLGRAIRMDGSLRDVAVRESDFASIRSDTHFQFIINAGTDAD